MPPIEYFKHVILELKNESGIKATTPQQQSHGGGGESEAGGGGGQTPSATYAGNRPTVRGLQKRFDEVSPRIPFISSSSRPCFITTSRMRIVWFLLIKWDFC